MVCWGKTGKEGWGQDSEISCVFKEVFLSSNSTQRLDRTSEGHHYNTVIRRLEQEVDVH